MCYGKSVHLFLSRGSTFPSSACCELFIFLRFLHWISVHFLNCSTKIWQQNIFYLIVVFRKDEAQQKIEHYRLESGHEPPKKRKKYIVVNERIRRVAKTWGSRGAMDYIRAISFNLWSSIYNFVFYRLLCLKFLFSSFSCSSS